MSAVHLSRRDFLLRSALTGLGGLTLAGLPAVPVLAIEPFRRKGSSRLELSLAAFSFRRYFKDVKPGNRKKKRTMPEDPIDMFRFIDYCADHNCNAAELTSYYFPADVDAEYMLRIRRHAFLRGVTVSGSSVGNNFTTPDAGQMRQEIAAVKRWIDLCAVMGAPHIRIFAGDAAGGSEAEARRRCIPALEECCAYAGTKGIFLGLENHHGIVAKPEGLLALLHAVKSPWLGANLDTGNFQTDDPYRDVARIAPYAVNVQFKVGIQRQGAATEEEADLGRIVRILRDANYQGFVVLEYQNAQPWEDVPRWLERMKAAFAA